MASLWCYTILLFLPVIVNTDECISTAVRDYCMKKNIFELPSNCVDYLCHGYTQSGVYLMTQKGPECRNGPVYCDQQTDGGGWLVFQRRENGLVDFDLDWNDYKYGFGDPNHEFWLGNDLIHELTKDSDQELRVDLESADGEVAYAKYEVFSISSEADKYRLHVAGYSGTATDALVAGVPEPANGMQFSTKDEDNDNDRSNCAHQSQGAWWYKGCPSANLNGRYLNGVSDQSGVGMTWQPFKEPFDSLTRTEMKIRPNLLG